MGQPHEALAKIVVYLRRGTGLSPGCKPGNDASLHIDIDIENGNATAKNLDVEFTPGDVTDSILVAKVALDVKNRYGRIDIAFNAGIAHSVAHDHEHQSSRSLLWLSRIRESDARAREREHNYYCSRWKVDIFRLSVRPKPKR